MSQNAAMTGSSHPAPQRGKANYAVLAFCLFAAPIGWSAHLLVNTVIAGQVCSGASVVTAAQNSSGYAHSVILVIDLVAILLAIAAGYVSYGLWTKTMDEKAGDANRLLHSGEGRTRFLALCGIFTSVLFGIAVIADVLGVLVGPPC